MKDVFGNILQIGDTVAYIRPGLLCLTIGEVVNLTPYGVSIKDNRKGYKSGSNQIVKQQVISNGDS